MLLGAGGKIDKKAWALNFGEVPTTDTHDSESLQSHKAGSFGGSVASNSDRIVYSHYQDVTNGQGFGGSPSNYYIAPVTCIDWNGEKIWNIDITIDADYSNGTSSSSNSYCRCSSVEILSDNSVIAIFHTDNLRLSSDRHRIFACKISATGAITSQKEVGYLREQTHFSAHKGETPFCKLVNGKLLLATGISKYSGSNHDKSGLNFAVLDTDLTSGGDRWKFRDDTTQSYKFIASDINITPGSEWFTCHVRVDGVNSSWGSRDQTHIMGKVNSNGTIEMKRWFQARFRGDGSDWGEVIGSASKSDGTKLYTAMKRGSSNSSNRYKLCIQRRSLASNTSITGQNNNESYANDTLDWTRELYNQTDSGSHTSQSSSLYSTSASALRGNDNGQIKMVAHGSYLYLCVRSQQIRPNSNNTSAQSSYGTPMIIKLNESDGSVVWVRSLSGAWSEVSYSYVRGETKIGMFQVTDNGILIGGSVEQYTYDTWKYTGGTQNERYRRNIGFISRLPLDGSQTKSRTDSSPVYHASATEKTHWWWSDDRVAIDSSGTSTPSDIYYMAVGDGGYDITTQSDDGNDLGIHVDSDSDNWANDQLSSYSDLEKTDSTKTFIFTEFK